jgi:hypothetical protein
LEEELFPVTEITVHFDDQNGPSNCLCEAVYLISSRPFHNLAVDRKRHIGGQLLLVISKAKPTQKSIKRSGIAAFCCMLQYLTTLFVEDDRYSSFGDEDSI